MTAITQTAIKEKRTNKFTLHKAQSGKDPIDQISDEAGDGALKLSLCISAGACACHWSW